LGSSDAVDADACGDGSTQTAAAPPTISEISWVIAAWRALL
jgi:hypothetical protein